MSLNGYNLREKSYQDIVLTSNLFDDPDRLFRIWEIERRTRDLNVKLMWENMKYFGSLISGLITASIALVGFIFDIDNNGVFLILIIILQIFIIYLAHYAKKDLQERQKRFFLVVSHLLKLEVLLGFYEDISQKLKDTRFDEDKYLFGEYQKNLVKEKATETDKKKDFTEDKRSSAYSIMGKVYQIMQFTMIAFIVAEIIILNYASYLSNQISLVLNI